MKKVFPFIFIALVSCQSAQVKIELVEQTAQCSKQSAGFEWVESGQDFTLIQNNPFLIKNNNQNKKSYDFENYRYLLVSAGDKPTRGYSYKLTGNKLVINDSVATIPLRLLEPPSGYAQAQVISFPCALIRAKRDDVDRLESSKVTFVLEE